MHVKEAGVMRLHLLRMRHICIGRSVRLQTAQRLIFEPSFAQRQVPEHF